MVMGRGAAQEVRDTWPTVAFNLPVTPTSLLVFYDINPGQTIGWFKVKHHWKEPADIDLIRKSTAKLMQHALSNPDLVYHMNAPGIGNGRLGWPIVYGTISDLPDNVLIYRGF